MKNIKSFTTEYIENLQNLLNAIDLKEMDKAAKILENAYKRNKKIISIGNGGSASTATHIASDMSKTVMGHTPDGNFKGFRAIALSDNISCVTAWGNDTGYENVYSGQLDILGKKGDVLVAISSSGNSKNILKAVEKARELQMSVISIAGFGGGKLGKIGDANLITHYSEYGQVEDIQLILNHIFTSYFQKKFKKKNSSA